MLSCGLFIISDFQTVLGISQLLRDVIIALGLLSDRINILHHTPQFYTAFVKVNIRLDVNLTLAVLGISQLLRDVIIALGLLSDRINL